MWIILGIKEKKNRGLVRWISGWRPEFNAQVLSKWGKGTVRTKLPSDPNTCTTPHTHAHTYSHTSRT